jgi:hypothetical protein
VGTGRCNLPCPGDPGLFCGGEIDNRSTFEPRFRSGRRLSRRDAPSDILLTLYAQIEAISGSLTTSDVFSTVDATTDSSLIPTVNPTIPVSTSSITQSFINSAITNEPSVPATRSQGGGPIVPPFPTTVTYNAGNFTRTEAVAPITTTMTYTVVDPNNPSQLTITEFCTTLRPAPCRQCQYQKPPTVEMTTIKVDCNACGHYGENTIILDVPVGAPMAATTRGHFAHETHQAQYHKPNPDVHKPRPVDDGDSHKEAEPAGVTKPKPYHRLEGGSTQPDHAKSYENDADHEFDQPQNYHHKPTGARESHKEDEPATVATIESKPNPIGGYDQPEPPKATFHRRPGPSSTPTAPSAPIVVVSGAMARTWDGIIVLTCFITGLVFLV